MATPSRRGDTERVVEQSRVRIQVRGTVQGVGFRPFVYGLATHLGLSGHVHNDTQGVHIELEGQHSAVRCFLDQLGPSAPPLSRIEAVHSTTIRPIGAEGFQILASADQGVRVPSALVPTDSATCPDCLRELNDPADRRFDYPLLNCTNCGPRFTIVRDLPYDRPSTTMAEFVMCALCRAEYEDPGDRRFHAQPSCCPDCGPRVWLHDASGAARPGDPVADARECLRRGGILALKGIGGYHLAVDATNPEAVTALRERKHRDAKPFAIMVAGVEQARMLGVVGEVEHALLTSWRRPIVLLDRWPNTPVVKAVAPDSNQLGVLIAYTPLHHVLLRDFSHPIVLTSGNVADEPIVRSDEQALDRLTEVADVILGHDRPIQVRSDDSLARRFRDRPMLLRRSRGYAPEAISLPCSAPRPILACGAEQKNTFSLARNDQVFVAQHIGDLENYETWRAYLDGIEHYRHLFGIEPSIIAHDHHPEYLSTKYALEQPGEHVAVQHHHAHIASCLVDNAMAETVIGVAFDGSGYGTDGTLWGGEFLVADLVDFHRLAHLRPVGLPGGASAIKQPWRMAVSHLMSSFGAELPRTLDMLSRHDDWGAIARLASAEQTPLTTSAGRLFDAVAAIVGVRDFAQYEGQAAIQLEQIAEHTDRGAYPMTVLPGEVACIDTSGLIRGVVQDLESGTPSEVIAARTHNGVARMIVDTCVQLRDAHALNTVALSGGVFQNMLLLERTVSGLDAEGFRTLVHSRVPPNDGGISLGQAAIAGARDRAGLVGVSDVFA